MTRPLTLAAALVLATGAVRAGGAVRIAVDLTGAPRNVVHTTLAFPASPGPMTLAYPEWLPGEHEPSGPIKNMAGLTVRAAGQDVPWTRDPKDMFAFHVQVPRGVSELRVDFDLLGTAGGERFSSGASMTARLAVLSWNQVVLYPAGVSADAITYEATLKLPVGWSFATALPVKSATDGIVFEPASLTTLVDSPVLAGAHLRKIALDQPRGGPMVELDVAADNPAALAIPPDMEAAYRALVREAYALFGAHHYREYHFLLTLSDQVAHFGLEHHESSDDRARERSFIDPDARAVMAGLLPHEFAHSWNGKYRRPAGLNPGDFHDPADTRLLWVYEGLTQYLGWVLSARSGLRTVAADVDDLALAAAELEARGGRRWRPLADTAAAAPFLYETPEAWHSWRRSVDFYDEGTLIWLEADVTIRRLTHGAKSLDDFCQRFHGGGTGRPEVKTYGIEDVAADLNAVAAYDWAAFFRERLDRTGAGAPLGGVSGAGWKLAYAPEPSPLQKSIEEVRETVDVRYSAGLQSDKQGLICDVVPDSGAWNAGVSPGMKIIAVDGLKFSDRRLRDAIAATKNGPGTVRLLLERGEAFFETGVDFAGGERYPRLERDPNAPDLLGAILAPRAEPAYKSGDTTSGR